MAAASGPAPWDHEAFWKWREGFKRVTGSTLKKQGVDWSLNSGYRQNTWDKEPRKPQMRSVKLYNGKTVQVPEDDYQDYIGYNKPAEPDRAVSDYLDKVFDGKSNIEEVDGVGHIYNIRYSPSYQVLWVEFDNDGAVVVFFRVPKEVYSELYHLAISKSMAISSVDGTQRHVLGMRFWDIVRIRGQRTGGRYRYEYAVEGERKSTPPDIVSTKIYDTDEQIYDKMAQNMLTGEQLNKYHNATVQEKEKILKKAGIL
jgi:hypothetical protein